MVPRRFRAQRPASTGRVGKRGTRGVALGALALLVIVVTACSSDDGDKSARTTTTSGSPSVTIGIICTSPADAAQTLQQAWEGGDRGAAARCANESAVASLFGNRRNRRDTRWTFEGCESSVEKARCSYRFEGGGAVFVVAGNDAAGWVVTKVELIIE